MTKTYNDKDLQNFIRQTIGDINANLRLGALSQEESSNDIALYDEELVKRTVFRFFSEEIRKQKDLEDIFDIADEELTERQNREGHTVDDDWAHRFVGFAKNITESDLKRYWGKLLAGEIESPGTFSYRTMLLLSQLSSKEAQRIRNAFRYALISDANGKAQVLRTRDYNPLGMSELLFMQELGLISTENVSLNYENVDYRNHDYLVFHRNEIGLAFSALGGKVSFPIYKLTDIGRELLFICSDVDVDVEYLKMISELIVRENKGRIFVKGGRLHFKDEVRWDMDELLFEINPNGIR